MPETPNVPFAHAPRMVDPMTAWVLSLCKCCWTGCDCGCIEDCPLHRERR
jgi:hypothetical protein